jgi:Putative phage tail protein
MTKGRITSPGGPKGTDPHVGDPLYDYRWKIAPFDIQGLDPRKWTQRINLLGVKYWYNPDDAYYRYLENGFIGGYDKIPYYLIDNPYKGSSPSGRDTSLTGVGQAAREMTANALSGKIAVLYGLIRVGGDVFIIGTPAVGSPTIIGYGLGQGELGGLVSVTAASGQNPNSVINPYGGPYTAPFSTSADYKFSNGSLTQAPMDLLWWAAGSPGLLTNFDMYPGLGYVAMRQYIDGNFVTDWLEPKFLVQGRKVYDPRLDTAYTSGGLPTRNSTTVVYSNNPALCLADYMSDNFFGYGVGDSGLDWDSVLAAANYCDVMVSGLHRHTLNIAIQKEASHEAIIDSIRAHFRCTVIPRNGKYAFVIDKVRASVYTFTKNTARPVKGSRVGSSGVPTAGVVNWNNPNKDWNPDQAPLETQNAQDGIEEFRKAEWTLDGCTDPSEAARDVAYLLGKARLNGDFEIIPTTTDALPIEVGDRVTYTDDILVIGNTLEFIVDRTQDPSTGEYDLALSVYDPAIYSDVVTLADTKVLGAQPDPTVAPAPVTGLTAPESGSGPTSKLVVDWTPSVGPWAGDTIISYRRNSGTVITLGAFASGPVYIDSSALGTFDVYAQVRNVNNPSVLSTSVTVQTNCSAPPVFAGSSYVIDSPTFFVDNVNHRVGIGTITPGTKLDVQAAGGTQLFNIAASSVGTGYVYGLVQNTGGQLILGVDKSIGGGIGTGIPPYSSVVGSFNATNLVLVTSSLPRVVIGPAGNVGIGTTAPITLLHVKGAGNNIAAWPTGGNNAVLARFVNAANLGLDIATLTTDGHVTFTPTGTNKHIIFGHWDGGAYAEDMRVAAGNVGIGHVPANGKLDMKGNLWIENPTTDHAIQIIPATTGGVHIIENNYVSGGSLLPINIRANNGTQLYLNTGGAVGIGTATPSAFTFQVAGHTGPDATFLYDLGKDNVRWRALYAAELRVQTLVAQKTITTIGGRILIGPTTKLTTALTNVATTIFVEDNQIVSGDRIYMESAPGGVQQIEFMAVTSAASGTGPYSYTVTRDLDATGANTWGVGDAVFNTGHAPAAGDTSGFIDIYSVRGTKASTELGPTIVGNVRNSATFNDWSPRWAIGNLNGLYGYATNTYGVAMGVPTGAWVKIDPTNGVRIGFNATTNIQLDAAGNATFVGAITAASGTIGGWNIGSVTLSSGGIVLTASGTPSSNKIYVGTGNYGNTNTAFYVDGGGSFSLKNLLTWNGTILTIVASDVVLDNTGIRIPQGSGSGYVFTLSGTSRGGLYSSSASVWMETRGFVHNASVTCNGGFGTSSIVLSASSIQLGASLYDSGGTKILGTQGAAVAHATGTLADCVAQLNTLIDRFAASAGGHGLIA